MLIPTIVMGIFALTLLGFGYYRGEGEHIYGLKYAFTTLIEILPMLLLAFIIAGMVQSLLPQDLLNRWIGAESGFRGIMVGTIAGGLSPGGPFVSLPIAVGLIKSGASVGTMVAYLTGWSLWAVTRLPLEVGILGWRLTLIRICSTFFFPPIAGWIAQIFFSRGA